VPDIAAQAPASGASIYHILHPKLLAGQECSTDNHGHEFFGSVFQFRFV
jgi:hypothetical protein